MSDVRTDFVDVVMRRARSDDDRVRSAFLAVERPQFFEPGPWHVYEFAGTPPYFSYRVSDSADPQILYDDIAVALDAELNLNTGLPSVWAKYLCELGLRRQEEVLHVGCGTGYYTAIMAELIGGHGRVVACEVHPSFARAAASNLEPWPQVVVREADGTKPHEESFDAIVVSASVTDIPLHWLRSLRVGGRLLVTLGFTERDPSVGISLGMSLLIVKSKSIQFTAEVLTFPYMFDCIGAQSDAIRAMLSGALDRGGWDQITELRTDQHENSASCWTHTGKWCLSCR